MKDTTPSLWQRIASLPTTKFGRWAVGLALVFVVMVLISAVVTSLSQASWLQTILPFYSIFMILCALAAGVNGFIAMIWKNDRSWMVILAILLGLFIIFLLIGEFLIPPFD